MNDKIDRYKNRIPFDFEDHFNLKNISQDKIQFARHYVETNIGADLDEDPLIVFSPIASTVFGYMVAHIAVEYEKFKEKN
jgi:hypothetical protein